MNYDCGIVEKIFFVRLFNIILLSCLLHFTTHWLNWGRSIVALGWGYDWEVKKGKSETNLYLPKFTKPY